MIYDCFTFFNELDMLEIRLNELDNHVDKFVIVEATKTFTGNSKPLYFKQNKHRFSKFLHKIIHVIVDDIENAPNVRTLPNYQIFDPEVFNYQARAVEAYQRNSIVRGLSQAGDNDLIIVSDVDEIPNKNKFKYIQKNYSKSKIWAFDQKFYYYYLNVLSSQEWTRAKCTRKKDLTSPQELRMAPEFKVIPNGGWHFSYLGGISQIQNKLNSICHQEFNTKKYTDNPRLHFNVYNNLDIFNRPYTLKTIKSRQDLPSYLQKNLKKYNKYIKKTQHFDLNTRILQSEIFNQRSQTDTYLTKIKQQQEDLSKSSEQINQLTQDLQELKTQLEYRVQDLHNIQSSKTYRLWQKFNQIKRKITGQKEN